jgi:hypothetical protein
MAIFPLGCVLSPRRRLSEPEAAGSHLRRTKMYASAQTLCVSPRSLKAKADAAPAQSPGSSTCPEKKSLIYEEVGY